MLADVNRDTGLLVSSGADAANGLPKCFLLTRMCVLKDLTVKHKLLQSCSLLTRMYELKDYGLSLFQGLCNLASHTHVRVERDSL